MEPPLSWVHRVFAVSGLSTVCSQLSAALSRINGRAFQEAQIHTSHCRSAHSFTSGLWFLNRHQGFLMRCCTSVSKELLGNAQSELVPRHCSRDSCPPTASSQRDLTDRQLSGSRQQTPDRQTDRQTAD